ncbi:MAG: hypothetical protein K1X56_00665 [Flavobacteriales bacterium]|nr:hypothetical protein [Flavobacteriales bacterium]
MFVFRKNKIYKQKIFVIGLGKTGTTSTELALKELGFLLGDQRKGELLLENWAKREFSDILDFCDTAEAFQDVPFCLPYTFIHLHHKYPKAKFILTQRDSPDDWADSLIRFHSKLYSDGKRVPNAEDLKNGTYIFKGRPYISNRLLYSTPENDLYNREYLVNYYLSHNNCVREFFRHIPNQLLEINVAKKEDYHRFCEFLERTPVRDEFPWENKT